jgi:hypothetical protein
MTGSDRGAHHETPELGARRPGLVTAPVGTGLLVTLGAVAFLAVVGYLMSSSLQWVELDGDVIRCRRLLSRKIVEHRVSDSVDGRPIHTDYPGPTQNAILDFLLDTSDRGHQLVFKDGSRVALIRADTYGVDGFLGALAEQLRAAREGKG